jgi:hypothetical protein
VDGCLRPVAAEHQQLVELDVGHDALGHGHQVEVTGEAKDGLQDEECRP